jgi:uncharacterized protein (TIGR03435 family)
MKFRSVAAFALLFVLHTTLLPIQSPVEFEVASIHPSNTQTQQVNAGAHVDGTQLRYTLVPLINYIAYAYDVRTYQIVGPDWLRTQYFDLAAKMPEGYGTKQVPQMLRTLLRDRFGLKVHSESKEFPVYALQVTKAGLKMKELPADPSSVIEEKDVFNLSVAADRNGATYSLGGGSYFIASDKGFEGKRLSMWGLASMLTPLLEHPAIDMTGIKGFYDFVLSVSEQDRIAMGIRAAINAGVSLPPQALRALDNASGDSFIDALQKLGLTLVSSKANLDVIVVDAMQKTPTEN